MAHAHSNHPPVNDERLSSEGADDHVDRKTYITVFILLMVGLVVTMVAWMIPFHEYSIGGRSLGPLGIVIAFLIATAKGVLVVLYFMHVKHANRLTKIFVVAGLFWLAILIGLTLNDYATRAWLPMSSGWTDDAVYAPPTSVENAAENTPKH